MAGARKYRRFTVSDGRGWLLESGLRRGERPVGLVFGWHPYYEVRGRSNNYYSYTLDDPANLPSIVPAGAGAGRL